MLRSACNAVGLSSVLLHLEVPYLYKNKMRISSKFVWKIMGGKWRRGFLLYNDAQI
jgi:hypothetical protein